MSSFLLFFLTLEVPYCTLRVSEEHIMEDKVKKAIEDIRPSLQNDGGDIEFIKMEGNEVTVRLVGACAGCPMSQMTLKSGVERYLKKVVNPDITVNNDID